MIWLKVKFTKCPFCGLEKCIELPHTEKEKYALVLGEPETGELKTFAWMNAYGCIECKKVFIECPSLTFTPD